MKPANEALGYWTCEQGGRAVVKQTRKRGDHFYTQCDCCGLNQGTGAVRQQKIWDEAEFLPDVTVRRPANVADVKPSVSGGDALEAEKPSEPIGESQPVVTDDFNPDEPDSSEAESGTVSARGPLLAGAVLLLAAGVGVWMG